MLPLKPPQCRGELLPFKILLDLKYTLKRETVNEWSYAPLNLYFVKRSHDCELAEPRFCRLTPVP
jgi:hypothetical protein